MPTEKKMVDRVCVECGFSMSGHSSEFTGRIECPNCKQSVKFLTNFMYEKEIEKRKIRAKEHEDIEKAREERRSAYENALDEFFSFLEDHYANVRFSESSVPPLTQFAFAVSLGIDVKNGATKEWLSGQIDYALEEIEDEDELISRYETWEYQPLYNYEKDEPIPERIVAVYRKCTGTTDAHLLMYLVVVVFVLVSSIGGCILD